MSLHCLDRYVFLLPWESSFFFFFFLYSNFKSTGFLFQEHAGIKKNNNKPPTILSTQTLAKHKHLETGNKISTLFSL